ncbi:MULTISPECIES: 1-phosphofructokinase family hexose kinase [Winogradskyella]|uniref:1-phosphofructokinase family hexose kinase n=1 Tax=Winogradskyella TaxID=286104 RepID=UPI0015CA62C6|nr:MULTISPECIES: 1-phosphofructokinase family hexose kinase [Winogradskyella]QNK77903.1 1-phosphofructokinase family hexose kinase [Winogradskyella sp. PAMC22761]QXP79088.1 1-phosphofructokinase family hexose kinase [Winogradskyella sp. HaHa_3_26]
MNIITLTLNPALDKSATINHLVPEQKLKCHAIEFQAGGGGVNISRVLHTLGVKNNCMFTYGGDTGKTLKGLLDAEHLECTPIPVAAWTRENLAVVDAKTELQYRFGMPGKGLSPTEIETLKSTINQSVTEDTIFVMSGSIPDAMAADFYIQLRDSLTAKNVKIIIDTSGEALKASLKKPVFLMKPNQGELAQLAGKDFLTKPEQEAFAMQLIHNQQAEYVVVSLGARGAFLASADGIYYQNTPSVKVKSTIGAGDSMVAGLIYAIAQGLPSKAILKWGVICGVATTMTGGTNLASKENIQKVIDLLED